MCLIGGHAYLFLLYSSANSELTLSTKIILCFSIKFGNKELILNFILYIKIIYLLKIINL